MVDHDCLKSVLLHVKLHAINASRLRIAIQNGGMRMRPFNVCTYICIRYIGSERCLHFQSRP